MLLLRRQLLSRHGAIMYRSTSSVVNGLARSTSPFPPLSSSSSSSPSFASSSSSSSSSSSGKFIAVIDEGTSSTRTALFSHDGVFQHTSQHEFTQIMPQHGWVEHDPLEILDVTLQTMDEVMAAAGANAEDVSCLGITNQRETTVVWDRTTGKPLYNAIVWMDTRADSICSDVVKKLGSADALCAQTGLPVHAYFSGPKIRWMLDNVQAVREAVERGDALFGNIDTWLLWNLTGGANAEGAVHATDVSNASRTLLMDLDTLDWDAGLLDTFGVPRSMLPTIAPSASSSSFGSVHLSSGAPGSALNGVPITGILGDQQAALFGQGCFEPGRAKCTYGTGVFALKSTGQQKKVSDNGLLTTVSYQIEGQPANYALEGSVAIGGAIFQWLRDNLGIIKSAKEASELAATVEDNGGLYFVPAFSGLYAPHWRPDARGCLVGMTRFTNRAHVARAAVEALAFQVVDVLGAMSADSGVELRSLHVDGGATKSEPLMQFQSDVLGIPVQRPRDADNTTALGAAFAAGLGQGVYQSVADIEALVVQAKRWEPSMAAEEKAEHLRKWKKAIEKSLDWVDVDVDAAEE